MYRMYDAYMYLFLFCIHVVVDADDFFVLCYFSSVTSRSSLLSVVRTFYVHYYVMLLTNTVLLLFFSLSYFISSLLMIGESPCKSLYCTVLSCLQSQQIVSDTDTIQEYKEYKHKPLDVADMMQTFWRLITNPTLMCNNLASVFYFLGYMPYWVFMAKYIETQYRQSASTSSLITGELTAPPPLQVSALLHSKPHILHFTFMSFFSFVPLCFSQCPANC
jgi:hypothetical protein